MIDIYNTKTVLVVFLGITLVINGILCLALRAERTQHNVVVCTESTSK